MAGMKGVNNKELGSMRLAEKLDWKGLILWTNTSLYVRSALVGVK
jgi:hypothetical protein